MKQSVTLTPEEWKVFFLVDGRRSLREICRLADEADDLGTLQILWNLVRARLLRLVPASAAGAGARPPPPAPEPAREQAAEVGRDARLAEPRRVRADGPRAAQVEDDTREIVDPEGRAVPGQRPRR